MTSTTRFGAEAVSVARQAPFTVDSGGKLVRRRNAGGMVSVVGTGHGSWVAIARTEYERRYAGRPLTDGGITCRFITVDEADYRDFYHWVAAAGLWLVNHGLVDRLPAPGPLRRAWPRFRRVSEAVASAVAGIVPASGIALVHDVPMAGVAQALRALRADVTTSLYLYTATALPDELDRLPAEVRAGYLDGLAAFDTVGLSTERWRQHLADCFQRWQLRSPVLYVEEHGPDVSSLRRAAQEAETAVQYAWLGREVAGRALISQSGRADLSKGTLASLDAFERLIRQAPWVRGDVVFGLFVHSTHRDHPVYRTHERAIRRRVAELNARYGSRRWQPVLYRTDPNYHRHIALLQRSDVRLDNSVRDGMLLVEHPFVSDRSAVEALSRYTGSFDRLGHACLATDPFDPERTAGVLSAALEMGHAERRRRADVIRRTHDLGGPVAFEAAQLAHAVAMTRDAAGR